LKFAAILSSLIAVNPIWWCLTLSNGRLKRYPTMPSHIYSAADIATRKNWQTEPGLFLGKSKVAGGARKQFVNTFTIASTLDITTPEMIHEDRIGVCRDFAHLAIALCRCMNIPARYCTGYLGDIGVPPDPAPMDFNAWSEVFLGGHWYVLDARHNRPRIGRIVMARGRDAADVAISTTFGPVRLARFKVITEQVLEKRGVASEKDEQTSSEHV
jgi:hypothetical protein